MGRNTVQKHPERSEMKKVRKALIRFSEVVDSLECECDSYHGYVCTVHSDRQLAREALLEILHTIPDAGEE